MNKEKLKLEYNNKSRCYEVLYNTYYNGIQQDDVYIRNDYKLIINDTIIDIPSEIKIDRVQCVYLSENILLVSLILKDFNISVVWE